MADENNKTKGSMQSFVLVVLSAILSATVLFLSMTAQCVYALRAEVSEMKAEAKNNAENIKEIQRNGSPVVQRVSERLDNMDKKLTRIENILDRHTGVDQGFP